MHTSIVVVIAQTKKPLPGDSVIVLRHSSALHAEWPSVSAASVGVLSTRAPISRPGQNRSICVLNKLRPPTSPKGPVECSFQP
eukprot:COSAG03_NODE_1711_length_3618_cov_65.223643_4_plen_83_part_00